MIAVDYLIIALVVISAIVGLARGLLREAIAIVTWIVGLIVAWHFSRGLEPYLGGALAESYAGPWAARAIVLFGVLLVGAGIGALTSQFIRLSIFSGTDRLLGFVLGLVRGIIILGVLIIFCQMLRLNGESWWRKSTLIPYGEHAAGGVRILVGGAFERSGPALVAASER